MNTVNEVCDYLLAEAQKCQTPNGAGLLLDVRRRIMDGESVYEGNRPLHELADLLVQQRILLPASFGR